MLARTTTALVAVGLLTTVVTTIANAATQSAAQQTLDCKPTEGQQVVTVKGLTTTLPQPTRPGPPEERTHFLLDLGDVPAGTTAMVTASMSWSIEANNWNLRMEDAEEKELARSSSFQPGNPPVEGVTGFQRAHCEVFTLVSVNASAIQSTPEAVDSLDTVISVTGMNQRPPAISLGECHMTMHLFRDSAERLSAYVPDRSRYTMAGTVPGRPHQGLLTFWFYSCRGVAVDGQPTRPTNLSLVGVVVKTPPDRGTRSIDGLLYSAPITFNHYLVYAHTDNGQLAEHLERIGMPVERVRSISFERLDDYNASTSVASSQGSYSSSMSGWTDDTPHHHDNVFWHHNALLGESQLRIQIGDPGNSIADDWLCKENWFTAPELDSPCSQVSAEPGSVIAGLLGASTRDDAAAFNHLKFDADATLISYGGTPSAATTGSPTRSLSPAPGSGGRAPTTPSTGVDVGLLIAAVVTVGGAVGVRLIARRA